MCPWCLSFVALGLLNIVRARPFLAAVAARELLVPFFGSVGAIEFCVELAVRIGARLSANPLLRFFPSWAGLCHRFSGGSGRCFTRRRLGCHLGTAL